MSLKRYLFFAFGSLMLLFIAVQILLLNKLTADFHDTLGDQSAVVARRVAEITVENLFDDEMLRLEPLQAPRAPLPPEQVEAVRQQREAQEQQREAERQHQEQVRQAQEAERQRQQASLSQQLHALEAHSEALESHLEALVLTPHTMSEEEQALIKAELAEARRQALEQARQIKVEFERGSDRVFIEGFDAPLAMTLLHAPEQALMSQFSRTLFWALLLSGGIGLLLIYWLAQRLARPLEALDQGCQRLSAGELGHTLPLQGSSEVHHAIGAFNQMSQSLARMTEQQKTLQSRQHLAEIGEIARGLAHALRNPLHTIGLALERTEQADAEERQRWHRQIRAKLTHMDRTLTAMLTLSANGIDRSERHRARALVDDIILELSMANPQGVSFTNTLPDALVLTGAHSELRTMLHTLLVNAQEASPAAGEVQIEGEGDDQNARIRVLDGGAGLAPAMVDRLFEPHQSTKSDGSGMGLYLARRLARLWYGGDVELADRPDTPGCQATLTLRQGTAQ
ncbi:ATP-binding protein [Ferrimonas balearica]|uniref:ATP-binding protein n=1 Tax=Ferrimonas balearica TaxID=44012 RepID=UPI001C98E7B3|nr:ATP-binding protein [Ferrimonas balearica]MBY5992912.1 HAMP domain-containing protein [Ferrimonas balearica]